MESPFAPPLSTPRSVQEPKTPLVIGIINILFGTLGLLSFLLSYKVYYTSLDGQTGTVAELLRSSEYYASWMRILLIPGAVFCLLQIISGIGLIKSHNWARKLAIACAVYAIGAGLFVGYLTVTYMLPFSIEQAIKDNPQMSDPRAAQMIRNVAQAAGTAGAFLGLLYPIIVIIMLMQAKVRVHCIAVSSKMRDLIA